MRISINNSRDFLALLVRRKWWVIVPFLALTGAFSLLVYHLPQVYVSQTLLHVRPSSVPGKFVESLVQESVEQRLRTIELTVLSRTNLVKILNEFRSSMPELDGLNMDDQVAKLRSQIAIKFEQRAPAASQILFRISYQNRDAKVAQKIASRLAELFFEEDEKSRTRTIRNTPEFLDLELKKVIERLDESDQRLRKIRSEKMQHLPGMLEANLRQLDRLYAEKKTNHEALDRMNTQRFIVEQQLAETVELIPRPVVARPVIPPPAPQPEIKPQQAQIKTLPPDKKALQALELEEGLLRTRMEAYRRAQMELDEALTNRTPQHPDVQTAMARLNNAKALLPPEILNPPKEDGAPADAGAVPAEGSAAADDPQVASAPDTQLRVPVEQPVEMMTNPAFRSLMGELQRLKTDQRIRESDIKYIATEIDKYQQRVELTPRAEQDISTELRDNQELRKQHDELSSKLAAARLAESLNTRLMDTQFEPVDPANLPLTPEKPEKAMVALGAGIFSLLLSIALAIVVDVLRQRVWSASEVEAMWGVPVLVDIPEILAETEVAVTRNKWRLQLTSVMAAAAVYGVCLYGIWLKHGFILQQLDPILQKIVYR